MAAEASLIEQVKDRCKAAIIGSLVADAATAPLHWVYDLDVLGKLLSTVDGSEFYDPPQGPFYRRDLGLQSGYGDLNANMLKYLAAHGGKWDAEKYATGLMLDFGPGSEYDQFGQLEKGIDKAMWPVSGPWIQSGLRHFIKARRAGAALSDCGDKEDNQGDAVARMPALAATHAMRWAAGGGQPGDDSHKAARAALAAEAEAAVRVYQDSALTAGGGVIFARLLFDVLTTGAAPHHAIQAVIHELKEGSDTDTPLRDAWWAALDDTVLQWTAAQQRPYKETVAHFGNQCYLHQSLATPLASVYAHSAAGSAGQELYVQSIRTIHSGGGCCASRSNVAGALTGAAAGMAAVPQQWQEKTTRYAQYERQADALLAAVQA